MKYITVALLLSSAPCMGDEILLRNGKKISWKSVSVDGETYSVETTDGEKLKLKKSEVEKFIVERPELRPLTGSTFTLDMKKAATTDLVPKAQTDFDDKWKLSGKAIIGQGVWPNRSVLLFDYDLPDEYDLNLVVERVGEGEKDFAVGVVTNGTLCAYHFDAWDATKSTLALIDGKEGEAVGGKVFKPGKPRAVKVAVRKEGLSVCLDGKSFWQGRVDWGQVSLHPAVSVREKGKPFLVAAGGTWKVSSFTISHLPK